MVLHWRRCGRAGGRQNKEKKFGAAERKWREGAGRGKKGCRETHLENRIYDNLAECIKFERMRCTRRIGKTSIEALSFR